MSLELEETLIYAAIYLDGFKSDDVQQRNKSIRHLHFVATALGPERTCNELLPFLQGLLFLFRLFSIHFLDCLNDDRENLIALAEELANLPSTLGGPQNYYHLFDVLEQMCAFEDTEVREKAIGVLAQLFPLIPKTSFQKDGNADKLIQHLAYTDSSHANSSACSLTAVALTCVDKADRTGFIERFKEFIDPKTNNLPFVHETAARTLSVCLSLFHVLLLHQSISSIFFSMLPSMKLRLIFSIVFVLYLKTSRTAFVKLPVMHLFPSYMQLRNLSPPRHNQQLSLAEDRPL